MALLLGGVLLGALLGAMVVCFCSKACKKRRGKYYHHVTAYRTSSLAATNDVIRDTKIRTIGEQRSSGTDSAFGTLNTDTSSHMGTGTRPSESANNSTDRDTRSTGQLSVNNLGRGTTGSLSGSTVRGHNGPTSTLNIPNSSSSGSMTRYGSHQNTGSSDYRDTESSLMLPKGSNRTHTSSNRSTASSVNRNTNRGPNIPYTKTLGTLTGHQDPSKMVRPPNEYDDDWDSDDSNYDKPYVSSPIVGEYSDPKMTHTVTLQRQTDGIAYDSQNNPPDRHVLGYETFK